ncbi:MAG: carboxypeptidase regulatory-like domain-containing protein [Acidobacteriota bacterium]|nr:carboxypeptidase regulatory-like domain-containing protein [Acidobacteriota bacterium]
MTKKRILLAGFLLIFMTSLGLAQVTQQSGRFEGRVLDDQGNPLPGVAVEATSPKLVGKATTVTDSNGVFRLFALPSGVYQITFTLTGFKPIVRQDLTLQLGQTLIVNVTMEPSTVEEQVTVVGEAPLVDVKSTVKGVTLTKEVFENLPRGRNFDSLVTTVPGVSNEYLLGGTSVDGASGLENMYYVDGTDVTDLTYGDAGQSVNFDFVDEVQVRASGYQAEYGGSLGGVISVITRSGGNQFSGEVLGYYSGYKLRDSERDLLRLNLTDTSVATYYPYSFIYGKNRDHRYEFGGNLGGYIIKDRLWFFGSFMPVIYRNNRLVTHSDGKTMNWRRNERQWNYSFKLTAQVLKNLRMSASIINNEWKYKGDLASRTSPSAPAVSFDNYGFTYPNYSASFTADWTASNSLLVSVRGGYFKADITDQLVQPPDEPCFQFLTEAPGGYFPTTNEGLDIPDEYKRPTGFYNYARANAMVLKKHLDERYSIAGDVNYFLSAAGEHSIKLGAQFVRQGQNYDSSPKYGILFFAWDREFVAYGVNYGRGIYGYYGVRNNSVTGPYGSYYKAYSNRWALYLQDSWTIGQRVTINYGVRAESEYIPSYATGNPDFENLKPIKFNLTDKIAPRVGIVYDVFGDSSLKLFGSFGLFYDVMKLQMASGSYGGFKWKSTYYKLDTYKWNEIGVVSDAYPEGFYPGDFLLDTPSHCFDFRAPSFESTDPNMKPMSQMEVSLGAEKKLGENLALSVRGVYKHLLWAIEDIGFVFPGGEGEVYFTSNPGGAFINDMYEYGRENGWLPVNAPDCPKAKREYWGLNIALDKRFSNNWLGGFSYTLSRLTGNYSGLASGDEYGRTDPNTERYFDLWYLAYDIDLDPIDGPMPGDRTHYFKAYGSYVFPFGLTLGAVLNAMSGVPTSTEWAMDVQGYMPYNRNNLGRSPFLWYVNFYMSYDFKLGGKTRMQVNLSVDNIFNIDTARRKYQIFNQGGVEVPQEDIAAGGWDISDYGGLVLDPRYKMKMDFYPPVSAILGFKLMF